MSTAWKVSKYRVFSDLYFPAFRLTTEVYGVNLYIQSKCWKIWTRKNSIFGYFLCRGKRFMHTVMDMIQYFRINTFTFIVLCAQIQFKGSSREIRRLLSNRLSNVSHKLETSNVKADLKKYIFKKIFVSLWLMQNMWKNINCNF